MSAASADQLAAVAQRARVRSLATVPTRGRYISTFANGAVTGGATWMYSRPDGRVFMVRVSPRRVWLDLQSAMAAALNRPLRVDAIVGPETVAALEAFTRSPAGTPLVHMLAPALLQVYHQGQGSLVVPTPVELPDPRRLVEIRGDATHHSLIDLTGSTDTQATTIPRTGATPTATRDEIQRANNVIAQAPPAPAPTPAPAPPTPATSTPRPATPAPTPAPPPAPLPPVPQVQPESRITVPPSSLSDSDKCRWYQDAHARDASIAVPSTCAALAPSPPPPPPPPAPQPSPTALAPLPPASAPPQAPSPPMQPATRAGLVLATFAVVTTAAIGVLLWKTGNTRVSASPVDPFAPTLPDVPHTRVNPSRRRRRR